ncbi:MAG TPA: BrnT family toxin [Pyrinomonadaceae bacterium]|nr:BrnT family toxin [Pyrinomonadaceae bacterium]
MKIEFEWNEEKAELNMKKHGVSFDEAATVFDDLFNVDFHDPKHSIEEHRFLIVGESNLQRLLIVSYAERNDKIRIISARELTPQERRNYEYETFE